MTGFATGLLNGVVDGIELRRAWDERDEMRERRKREDEWLEYERGRKRKADKRADEERAAYAAAYEATMAHVPDEAETPASAPSPASDPDTRPSTLSTRNDPAVTAPPTKPTAPKAGQRLEIPRPVEPTAAPSRKAPTRLSLPQAAPSVAVDAPQQPDAPGRPNRTPGRLTAPEDQAPERAAHPQRPERPFGNIGGGYEARAREIGASGTILIHAKGADRAAAELASGKNAETGETLTEQDIMLRKGYIKRVEDKMALQQPADMPAGQKASKPATDPDIPDGPMVALARERGFDDDLVYLASQGDLATQALETGIDPQTGEPLTEQGRREMQQAIELVTREIGASQSPAPAAAPAQVAAPERPRMQLPQSGPATDQARGMDLPPQQIEQAQQADAARRALETGIDPQTGQPLTEQGRREMQQAIDLIAARHQPPAPNVSPQAPTLAQPPAPSGPGAVPAQPAQTAAHVPRAGQPAPLPASPSVGNRRGLPAPQATMPAVRTKDGVSVPAEDATPAQLAATGQPGAMEAAVQAQAAEPAPSVQQVAAVADRREMPLKGAPDTTRAARTNDFLTRYAKVGAPMMIEHYLKTGNPQKAAAFEQFIDRAETREAMKSWADATFYAMAGDDERFISSLADAYNARGYFDDGYEAIAEKSGIIRDEQGNVIGAKITFKDTTTGKVFEQQFDGFDDLYRVGVHMLAPEQVFEHGWARIEAAETRRAAILSEMRKHGLKASKSDEERIKDAYDLLSKADPLFDQLPPEEQAAKAVAWMARFDAQGNLKGTGGVVPTAPTQQTTVPVF